MTSAVGLFLLQNNANGVLGSMFGGAALLVWLAIFIVVVAAGWKVFEKAGQPGWAIIVPIFNIYIMLKIVGRPAWWLVLYFIPVVNVVIAVIISMDMAKSFGQSAAFGIVLLFLLCGVGYLILAFGSARYVGPAAAVPQARAAGA
jgi:membrane-associated HD superfamily phosphohydrolase